MSNPEKVARSMAVTDELDPDTPLAVCRRIVGQTIPVLQDPPKRAAWNSYLPLAKLLIDPK